MRPLVQAMPTAAALAQTEDDWIHIGALSAAVAYRLGAEVRVAYVGDAMYCVRRSDYRAAATIRQLQDSSLQLNPDSHPPVLPEMLQALDAGAIYMLNRWLDDLDRLEGI